MFYASDNIKRSSGRYGESAEISSEEILEQVPAHLCPLLAQYIGEHKAGPAYSCHADRKKRIIPKAQFCLLSVSFPLYVFYHLSEKEIYVKRGEGAGIECILADIYVVPILTRKAGTSQRISSCGKYGSQCRPGNCLHVPCRDCLTGGFLEKSGQSHGREFPHVLPGVCEVEPGKGVDGCQERESLIPIQHPFRKDILWSISEGHIQREINRILHGGKQYIIRNIFHINREGIVTGSLEISGKTHLESHTPRMKLLPPVEEVYGLCVFIKGGHLMYRSRE